MNRERARELLPIIQAFAEGKTVQYKEGDEQWSSYNVMDWAFDGHGEYRVKPEPREFLMSPSFQIYADDQLGNDRSGFIRVREVLDD